MYPSLLTRRPLVARLKSLTAATVVGVLVATLTQQVPALAQEVEPDRPPVRQREDIEPVPVEQVHARPQPAPAMAAVDRPAPVWPAAAAGVAAVPAVMQAPAQGAPVPDGGMPVAGPPVMIGGLPVRATGAAGGSPIQLRLQVFDRAATAAAGVKGVLLRATPQNIAGAALAGDRSVRLSVDYGGFATGYGADWASRLRLVTLPGCALTTPGSRACAGRPLASDNNLATRTVSATVDFDGGSVLIAVQAAPSGPAGDYSATSLQPSSTWSAGGNSGGFTWSYPIRVPPGTGGPTPSVALSYSSQAVDGRHAASNNQPSWVGEGFDAWPGGFIERRYKTCAEDMEDGANNGEETGDLCWVTDNAVLNLNGTSGELLYNSSEQRWHLRADDGSRIERHSGASNGDNTGEYWVVTTTDGIQYWFGINRLPGWAAGDPVTNSTWTAPVFGNHAGEPCHATGFADSDCTQAWRWNLDYVVDLHGNSMSYWYTTEANRYGRNLDPDDDVSYMRGGYLRHISYGTRRANGVDSVLDADPPAQVVFTTDDRCLSSCTTHDETRWPDTPWDQECTEATCDTFAPTFWTTKRLASITTRVWGGSSYRNVERWTFTHSFPDPGDTTRAGLWLSKVSHQGLVGGTATLPDVEFTPVSLDNRVDAIDAAPAMAWHRVARIDTETGGAIAVTYSDRDCETSKPTLHTNTRRCYPVYWTREGEQDPTLDWFHKYVVDELREVDMVGGQPEVIHRYDYLGGAAWHYTDDDGLVDPETKTWSEWRGYGRVTETVGEGDTPRTHTETRFFRGMDGDKLPSGTRSVDVTDSQGATWPDHDWFAGMVREQITFNGPGGAEVSGQVTDPWASSPTASRTINETTVHARFTNAGTVRSRVALDGGRGDRTTRVTTSFDSFGMPTQVDDHGDVSQPGDEQCAINSYGPRNTDAWLVNVVHRVRTFAVGCAAASDPASLTEADVISDVRMSFDGNSYGTPPTRGLPTRTEEMSAWTAGTPSYVTVNQATYDVHGRLLEARDALNRPATTAYTPATGGPVTGTTVTNALGHVTTTTVDPAFGLATRTVDPNGKITVFGYDPLGRLTAVWLPGRDRTTQAANMTFTYGVRDTNVTFVTAKKLNASGNYLTTRTLYDGLLRQVQTQAPSPSVDGGRILSNTFYDNAGRPNLAYGAYYESASISTDLYVPIEPLNVPTQTRIVYDGASRPRAEIFQPYNVERWRTSYGYGGDRTDLTPPAGGTVTSTVTDARGRTVELRQYLGSSPTGDHDITTYDYDRKGQLVGVTDPAGNQWSYVYDLRGRKVETHDPDAGTTTMVYDNADQLTSTTDARNARLAYTYDALGRKRTAHAGSTSNPALAGWFYDTLAKGQLDRSVRIAGGQTYQMKIKGYTDQYQPTGIDVIIPGTQLGGTYTTNYTYWEDGSPDTVAWTATGDLPQEGLHYEYDPITGLPLTLRATLGTTPLQYVTNTAYNALGELEQLTMRTSSTGDAVRLGYTRELETSRLTGWSVDTDTAPFVHADVRYTYDPAGNITRIADLTPNPDDTQCFDYDYLRRLSAAWTPASGDCTTDPTATGLGGPAPYWLSWTHDKTGNRLTETDHRTSGDVTTSYNYPPAGGLKPHTLSSATTGGQTRTWTYGAAGHTLTRPDAGGGPQTLTWDIEGRLSLVEQSDGEWQSYLYDADGNRLIATDPAGKTLYLPGQEVRYDNATGAKTTTRYYDYHGQTIASRTTAGLTWLASDHLGTAQVAITDTSQQGQARRQTPFGTPRGPQPAWPNTQGYVGGTQDPTGMTHLGAREYDPAIGRFISVDPIMDLTDPQQMHGYTYANNNPIVYSDPTGLMANPGWVGGAPCIDGDCSYHNSDGSIKTPDECDASGGCGRGPGSSVSATGPADDNPSVQEVNEKITPEQAAEILFGDSHASMWNQNAGGVVLIQHAALVELLMRCVNEADREACMQLGDNMYLASSLEPSPFVDELANELLGINDAKSCFGDGSVGACLWLAASIIPHTKIASFLKFFRWGAKAADAASAVCSFSATTLVLMADGTTKPISETVPGDQVLAHNPETGEQTLATVLAVWAHEDILVELQVIQAGRPFVGASQASADARMVTVTTTRDHPFWNVTDRRWQPAEAFGVGDRLLTADGSQSVVVGLLSYAERKAPAYNLTIADVHTYYVLAGETPVLVHNVCWWTRTERAGDLADRYTPGQVTRDPASQWYHEQLSNDELLDAINNAEEGGGILVSRGGTILGGHHRWDELLTRIDDGRIDPDTQIRIEVFGGE